MRTKYFKENLVIFTLLFVSVSIYFSACKKKEETPAKTSQDCMNENGLGFFVNASGQCEWAQALGINNLNNHWSGGCPYCWMPGGYNSIDIEFFRNGSNTGGTGKTRCCNGSGAVGTFDWQMDPHNDKAIIISNGDSTFSAGNPCSMFTLINPNTASNPTSFSANVTMPSGTKSMNFVMVSGSF